jgi:hypothetical protein
MNTMSAEAPLTAPDPTRSRPAILSRLPDPKLIRAECPRRVRQEIDLLLLAIEALDLSGSEAMLLSAQELGLTEILGSRVALWRLRATNPLRRSAQRDPLSLDEAKALVAVLAHLARQLNLLIRQLLMAQEVLARRGLPMDHHFRLNDYISRFRSHFRARMNPRRAAVAAYDDDRLAQLALELLERLLFCTGTAGMERLWSGLFDGEVA